MHSAQTVFEALGENLSKTIVRVKIGAQSSVQNVFGALGEQCFGNVNRKIIEFLLSWGR